MRFTHLHVHSHYSLLDGLPKIDELLDYVKELGMDSVALTDHGVLYGAVEFFKKAKEKGIKPIIGAEPYMALENMEQRRPHIDDKRFHLVLLVKNTTGYKNLVKLITKAHLQGFYYKPRIDEELLAKHSEGLIALSGCLQGKIPKLILAKRLEQAKNLALRYKEIFGQDGFYLEIQDHPNLAEQKTVNQALIALSKELAIPLVASNDAHYLKPGDAKAQDILMMINTNADPNDPERLTMKADDFSLRTPEQMINSFKEVPQAIENTQKIKELCSFEFEFGKTKLPYFEVPDGQTADDYLRRLCYQNLSDHYEKKDQKIKDRLEHELSIIKQTGFASYFLIVQDFVNWARDNGIVVGPGRGSVAGSLISYLLNITEIDPLKHNLLFSRFMTGERISPPDIDLDFTDTRRDEVIDYVSQKYGQERVAQIITFGTMAARAVVRDVGRVLGYPYNYCDKIAKMIPMFFSLDRALEKVSDFRRLYEEDEKAKTLIDLAKQLEGKARHASTHACGVVIGAKPLDNYVPLQHPTQDEKAIVTQYEMHSIEDLGLLKMDFLGLKNLTIIEETINLVKQKRGQEIDLKRIPMDDQKTFELLQEAKTTSVFQLECLSGDTQVSTTTIERLYERKNKNILESLYLDEGEVHKNKILDVVQSGVKELFLLVTENNLYIKATQNHHFLTENGWKKLKDLKVGEKVLVKTRFKHLVYNTCKICGKQINGQKEGKSNFCYKCSASFYKNPSKKESRKKIREARIRFYQKGGKSWNCGVTKENSEVWRRTAEKISKALKGRTLEELWGKERAERFKQAQSKRNRGKNNPMFGKPAPHRKGGFRKDLGHYVRSSWEADFARILRLFNLEYEYEPKTFKLIKPDGGIIHYTPDFYVRSNNTFYEVKGWLHNLDKKKIQLFQKQYPQHNFVLINTTKFAELALKYKNLIKWECPRLPLKERFRFVKIKKIEGCGKAMTYDIAMAPPGNNFVANGFVVHNSEGMKRYLKALKPTKLEDIIAMVALYRPGPIALIPDYIKRKHGKKKIEYLHPKLEPILEDTYGIGVYQEQMMQIAQGLAGYSPSEADVLRKAIGKKIKSLLKKQKEKLIEGMIKNGIDAKTAEKVWGLFPPFARYGFPKAHATAYATIAYQAAYLKANYPSEFMTAVLESERADIERIGFLIEEAKKMGIEVLAPNINGSDENFTLVEDKIIRFGLKAIKNVGSNVVSAVVRERKRAGAFENTADFLSRIDSKDLNKKSLESLIKAGAFDDLEERGKLLENLEKILEWSREVRGVSLSSQMGLFGKPRFKLNLLPAKPASKRQRLEWEKELLGLYVTENPLEEFKEIFKKGITAISSITNLFVNKRVKIGGIISGIKKVITRDGSPMLFVNVRDLTSKIEVIIFPSVLKRKPDLFQENKIVMIKGRVDNRDDSPKIICEDIEEIIEKE